MANLLESGNIGSIAAVQPCPCIVFWGIGVPDLPDLHLHFVHIVYMYIKQFFIHYALSYKLSYLVTKAVYSMESRAPFFNHRCYAILAKYILWCI